MKGQVLPIVAFLLCAPAFAQDAPEPLRLPDGEPLVCIYYFSHWWEPWKTSDDAVLKDLRRLKKAGFNTILLDQEWSQALDGNWKWLDRDFKLANEAGMKIVPWLSLKSWSDVNPQRKHHARKWFKVDVPYGEHQDGTTAAPVLFDDRVISLGAQYTLQYLERFYRNPSLLRLKWEGRKSRPVVCMSVESAWHGGFGPAARKKFIDWLEKKYKKVKDLNEAWGTDFKKISDVDPKDASIFPYKAHAEGKASNAAAVEDHVEWRSQVIAESHEQMGKVVRRRVRDVLFLAEIPYEYGAGHPHAKAYRVDYGANPSSCDWGDMILFRCTSPLGETQIKALAEERKRTGKPYILTYRTGFQWDLAADTPNFASLVARYADNAVKHGNGFGFYSYNEMVDMHVAYSPQGPKEKEIGWTAERSERAIRVIEAMAERYIKSVGAK